MADRTTTHTPLEGDLEFRAGDKPTNPTQGKDPIVEILIGGRIVGVLSPPRPWGQSDWCIRLLVRDASEQGWHWTELLSRFSEEKHARFSVKQADNLLRNRYDLAQVDCIPV